MGIRPDVLSYLVTLDLVNAGHLTDVQRVAASALQKSLFKKFEDDSSKKADKAAVELFKQVNKSVLEFQPEYVSPVTDALLLGMFSEKIHKFYERHILDVLNGPALYSRGRLGPGESVGANGTDFYTKLFSSKLTCSSEGLYTLYKACLKSDPRALEADNFRQQFFEPFKVVRGGNLSCVPKSVNISRTICTEPTLNMFFQLGLGSAIVEGLRRSYGIYINRSPDGSSLQQQMNRDLACIGSLTGTYATIDLSSASDCISLALIDRHFPKQFGTWLKFLRCKEAKIEGQWTTLNMLSTMGNGYTFPLQTLIFTAVVHAAYDLTPHGGKSALDLFDQNGNAAFGVYGDDIICHAKARQKVYRLLYLLGFRVNESKSFFEGDFRESCGGDYFRGHDVRGVYVKSLRTPQDRLVVWNRLAEWSASHDIRLSNTLKYIRDFVPDLKVPMYESYDAGLRWPVVPDSVFVSLDTQSLGYFKYHPRVKCLRVSDGEVKVPNKKRDKARLSNHHGLLISLLHGSLRRYRIPLRPLRGEKVRYSMRRAITSCWTSSPRGVVRPNGWMERYESIVLSPS